MQRSHRIALATLSVSIGAGLAAVACGPSQPATGPSEAATNAPEASSASATNGASTTDSPSAPAAASTPAPVASATASAPPKDDMAAAKAKQIEDAKKMEVGDTNCDKFYSESLAIVQSMEKAAEDAKKVGTKVTKKGALPTKEKFLKACNAQPAIFQQCSLMSYALEHGEECQKGVTPEMVAKFKAAAK